MVELSSVDYLKELHPWPTTRPDMKYDLQGWFCGENMHLLRESIKRTKAEIILELGSWKGLSTTFLLENSDAIVIAIDHWKGSEEHIPLGYGEDLPTLYEQFLFNCWKYRDRLIPIRDNTVDGLQEVSKLGVSADVIYVDAAHDTQSVIQDLDACLQLFPNAEIIGDDWSHDTVKEAIRFIQKMYSFELETMGVAYRITEK
jgi:hypothetical protein